MPYSHLTKIVKLESGIFLNKFIGNSDEYTSTKILLKTYLKSLMEEKNLKT